MIGYQTRKKEIVQEKRREVEKMKEEREVSRQGIYSLPTIAETIDDS